MRDHTFEKHPLFYRLKGVRPGHNTDEEQSEEGPHVLDALGDHSHAPAEHAHRAEVEEESQPDANGSISLHGPEALAVNISHTQANQNHDR